LVEREADDARATIEAIAEAIREPPASATLAGGSAGTALFYASLAQIQPDRGWAEVAIDHLSHAIDSLSGPNQWSALFPGLVGIAWVVEHLQGRLKGLPLDDLNGDIDAVLDAELSQPWSREHDLMYGLVGIGAYAALRCRRRGPTSAQLLRKVVAQLDARKVAVEGGYAWHTAVAQLSEGYRGENPEGAYDLGVAHGCAAVVALLAQAASLGVEGARGLFEGASAWLLSQRQAISVGSYFADLVTVGQPQAVQPSRIGWCYGDLGISASLLAASMSFGDQASATAALEVARHVAARGIGGGSLVDDAFLCHGASGNGHLFNRLWQSSGDDVFRHASRCWFREVANLRRPGRGVAGFEPRVARVDVGPFGFLQGAAGIGLALCAAVSTSPPAWDEVLMISVDDHFRPAVR